MRWARATCEKVAYLLAQLERFLKLVHRKFLLCKGPQLAPQVIVPRGAAPPAVAGAVDEFLHMCGWVVQVFGESCHEHGLRLVQEKRRMLRVAAVAADAGEALDGFGEPLLRLPAKNSWRTTA